MNELTNITGCITVIIDTNLGYSLVTKNIISTGWLLYPVNLELGKFPHPINSLIKTENFSISDI